MNLAYIRIIIILLRFQDRPRCGDFVGLQKMVEAKARRASDQSILRRCSVRHSYLDLHFSHHSSEFRVQFYWGFFFVSHVLLR